MKKLSIVIFLCLLISQTQAQEQLKPTKSQYNKLLTQRQKIYKLQQNINNLQSKYIYESLQLQELCKQVIIDNHWSSSTKCDIQQLSFFELTGNQTQQQQHPQGPMPTVPKEENK